MDGLTLSLVCFAGMLFLIAIRTPIGVALGVVSFLGFWELKNFNVAIGQMREVPYYFAANWDLSAIPMFLLMGSIVYVSGIATSLFKAARLWLSALPGGLAVAANIASAGFAAGCGSSVAAAAAMGRLAIPEMLKAGYEKGLATGVVASAGTIAALIPPSILMVVWGGLMSVSIGGLFLAGIIPGMLIAGAQMTTVYIYARRHGMGLHTRATFRELAGAFLGAALALMTPIIIVGGIVGGVFTPTEASVVAALYALAVDPQAPAHALLFGP